MKNAYLSRQVFFAFNQFAIICYLGFMAAQNDFIQQNSFVHFLLLSFLIFDAEYISYKNVKGNKTLNHFSLLLLLLGWQFLLYLFDFRPISDIVSTVLLPICFYQSIYFVQAFLFQESAYRGQKPLLAFLKTSCIIAVFCFFVSDRAFFAAYQLQVLLSTVTLIIVGIMQRKRIMFVAKSQWKRILFSSIPDPLDFFILLLTLFFHFATISSGQVYPNNQIKMIRTVVNRTSYSSFFVPIFRESQTIIRNEEWKMTERTRKHPVQFYLSDDEQYILDEKFRLSKMRSKSAFLRKLVLYGFVYDVDYSHIREMNALLGNISGNLNQIAKRVNTTNTIYKKDMEDIKELMDQIWQSQKSIVLKQPLIKQ